MTRRAVRALGVALAAIALAAGASGALAGANPFEAGVAQSATQIDSCTTIDSPGSYVLTTDIQNGGKTPISQACIEITADDVNFDGGGHLVDGRGVSHTKGIAVVDAENVTVRNVEVDDWHSGVLVENGSATVEGVRTFSNSYGVRLENATGATITNNTIEGNLVGVSVGTADATLSNNEFSENEIEVLRDD